MTRKELLAQEKEMIKLETKQIRTLKERNKTLARNHALGWKEISELDNLREMNSRRHYWYFRLKNLYSAKHGKQIVAEFNSGYPEKTAVYMNEKGIEDYIISLRTGK